jgi:hypothetical protein
MHVDTLLARAAAAVAEALASKVRRGKWGLALAANLACVSLSSRGCSFAAHAESIPHISLFIRFDPPWIFISIVEG